MDNNGIRCWILDRYADPIEVAERSCLRDFLNLLHDLR